MDIPPIIKNNWPVVIGGVLGVGILIYVSRGSSGGTQYVSAPDNTAANQSYALAKSAQDAQVALADKQANVAAMQAQGAMVSAIAGAAGGLVQSLNQPTVAALNSAAAENVATIQGAVANSIAGYTAQGSIVQSTAAASSAYAQALAQQSQALATAVSSSQQAIGQSAGAQATATANTNQANAAAGSRNVSTAASLGTAALMAFSDERVKTIIGETERDSVSDIATLQFIAFDYDESKIGKQLVPHFDVGITAQQAERINSDWVIEIDGVKQIVLPTMLMSAMHAVKQLAERVEQLEIDNGA